MSLSKQLPTYCQPCILYVSICRVCVWTALKKSVLKAVKKLGSHVLILRVYKESNHVEERRRTRWWSSLQMDCKLRLTYLRRTPNQPSDTESLMTSEGHSLKRSLTSLRLTDWAFNHLGLRGLLGLAWSDKTRENKWARETERKIEK